MATDEAKKDAVKDATDRHISARARKRKIMKKVYTGGVVVLRLARIATTRPGCSDSERGFNIGKRWGAVPCPNLAMLLVYGDARTMPYSTVFGLAVFCCVRARS
jgi:hypothetical protein